MLPPLLLRRCICVVGDTVLLQFDMLGDMMVGEGVSIACERVRRARCYTGTDCTAELQLRTHGMTAASRDLGRQPIWAVMHGQFSA